ncbi:MAG: NfeD family protein [Nitriliruptoraceae bacterium]
MGSTARGIGAPVPAAPTTRRLVALLVVCLGAVLLVAGHGRAQDAPAVVVAPIEGEIDLGIAPFLDRVLADAEADGAAAVLLEIDTPGGRLDAVLEMRQSLLASPVRSIALIDTTALSAGALIALAAEEIHVVPAGIMGAATPVDAATGATADAKVVSAVRSIFRATAQERDRDPLVAEAMVDPAVEIEGLVDDGQLLTLDDRQMLEVGYADSVVGSRDELLADLDLTDGQVVEVAPTLAERLVRLLTSSLLAPLLLSVGVWLLVGDLLSGGVGIGAAIGVALLGAFFYGHLLAGLSGWEDILLVAVGVVLLLVEVFVVPGVGVAGVLGVLSLLGGGVLAMVNRDLDLVPVSQLLAVAGRVTLTFLLVSVVIIAIIVLLARRSGQKGMRLSAGPMQGGSRPVTGGWLRWFGSAEVLAPDSETSADAPPHGRPEPLPRGALVGRQGVALSDLRPAGVARIDGHRIDVVSDGEWLAAGDPVTVVSDEGYRRVVQRAARDD